MVGAKVQILPLRKVLLPPSYSDDSSSKSSQDGDTESDQQAVKKKRTSTPKVRSGCVTCKIRRVKCDEVRPECNRCTSTGRTCDGYSIKPRKKRATRLPRQNPGPTTKIDPAELRALEFFHHNTAPALSSYFDADFWTRLVLQMSYVEPTIRHAMVALGALHEQREQGVKLVPFSEPDVRTKLSNVNDNYEQFALGQYGKAISLLSNRLNSESSIEVALLASILFVCVEFFRGDVEPAVQHFRAGMAIVISLLSNKGARTAGDTIGTIREHMLPFLNRIELLNTLYGTESPYDYPVHLLEAVPHEFENIKQARDSMVHLANLSVRFIRTVKFRKYDRLVLPDDFARRAALTRQLDVWAGTLDRLLQSGTISEKKLDAAKILRIHYLIASAWVARCIFAEECSHDESTPDFNTVVSLAESIHAVSRTYNRRATFLFDIEIVSPLYYVATRCRHPLIRRRAIQILKQTQRRESLWDANKAAAVAERLMLYEEVNLTALDGSQLPAEEDRIHRSHIDSDIGSNAKRHVVTFGALPNGLEGAWKFWKEEIILP